MYGSNEQEVAEAKRRATEIKRRATLPPEERAILLEKERSLETTQYYYFLLTSMLAGVGSGMLASVLCAPLDLIKTQMQVWGQIQQEEQQLKNKLNKRTISSRADPGANKVRGHDSLWRMLRDIVQTQGYRGAFRGLGVTLVTVPTFWGVYFPLYNGMKTWSLDQYPNTNPALIHMSSAVVAGAVSDVICNPMFVIRTRLQTEALHHDLNNNNAASGKAKKPNSILQTARALHSENGFGTFYRGMTANILGLSHVAVQFPVYEQLKQTLKQHRKKRRQRSPHSAAFEDDNDDDDPLDLLLASGLSKMTASLLTYPHEVIRSRMMDARVATVTSQPSSSSSSTTLSTTSPRLGFVATCRQVAQTEGWVGFYAGLSVSLLRVVPNTCITFVTYELIVQWVAKRQEQQQR